MGTLLPRIHVITDTRPGRDPLAVVRAAVAAAQERGAAHDLAVQVRVEDDVTDRQAYQWTVAILRHTRPVNVLCLVNDRLHVAVAADADGGHVGVDDLPVAAARRVVGVAGVLGATARDPDTARAAVSEGATYLGVGPCWSTTTKDGLPEPIGPAGVAAVAGAVTGTPVLAIGGITVDRLPTVLAAGAHGVAVVGALAAAADPYRAAGALLDAVAAGGRA